MMTPQRIEDYLKTIYKLSASGEVRACRLAEELGMSRPTVSVALRQLAQKDYLSISRDNAIALTDQGLRVARTVLDRYQIIYDLLVSLRVDQTAATRDACWLEHGLSETSYQALKQLIRERRLFTADS